MKALSIAIQKIWPMLKFLQTDKQTDRPKTICPDLSIRGHKKCFKKVEIGATIYSLN
jgi:hypothetical protein